MFRGGAATASVEEYVHSMQGGAAAAGETAARCRIVKGIVSAGLNGIVANLRSSVVPATAFGCFASVRERHFEKAIPIVVFHGDTVG